MDKLFNKENIVIAVAVIFILIQTNYFATKLDLANVKLEMAQIESQLKKYSDDGDKEVLNNIELKINQISNKLDKLR